MSLRFIYGRAGCGKTHFCLEELKTKIENKHNNSMFLLVPEQYTFQAERDLIGMLQAGGILKNEVLSFRRLSYRVFNEVGGITYPHIHPAGKSMILYRILDKSGPMFRYFKNAAQKPGFVNELSDLITEFKHYNVTFDMLDDAYNKLDENSALKQKVKEINTVYDAFEKTLKERYRDVDDDLTIAAEKMKLSNQFRDSEVWIDGFSNFTPQQYKVIEVLLSQAKRVSITLTTDSLADESSTTDIFSPAKSVYRKIINLAANNNIMYEKPVFLNPKPLHRFEQNIEFSHLEKNFYKYPYRIYPDKTSAITLFSSVNIFSEIEAAARDILRLCRDQSFRFRDIAVVTRNLDEYQKLIETIFSDYGIPCFMDSKLDISNHPLVRLILSMLEIFTENWSYESVFRYLKTGLTGIEQHKIDLLENYVLSCGIYGKQWVNNEKWNMSPDLLVEDNTKEYNLKFFEQINEIRRDIVRPLMTFRNKTKGRRGAEDFCTALFDFLCELKIPEQMEDLIEKFRLEGELTHANEYSQVWNMVMGLMDQIVEVMAGETFGIERFTNILSIGFSEYKIGLVPASIDQVLVGSIERSKSHDVRALYILGTNDGVIPSRGAKEGIITDDERDKLRTIGVELAQNTRDKVFDEDFLIYKMLTTPSDYLRISWPISDQDGKTLRPSIIISKIMKIFPACKTSSNILPPETNEDVLNELSARNAAFRQLVLSLRQNIDGNEILPVWQDIKQWFLMHDDWKVEIDRAQDAFSFSNIAQPIDENKISQLYGELMQSSISKFEQYSACPFSFFVQYGLGAKERKIFEFTAPDVGTFLHTAVERFSKAVEAAQKNQTGNMALKESHIGEEPITWRTFDRQWCEETVSDIVDDMISKMKGTGLASSKRVIVLASRLKNVVTRAVWLIAEHIRKSSFNPIDYEAGFGYDEKYPPITIELDNGKKVYLQGRVDRIDEMQTPNGKYLRIIDYKSGSKDFKLKDVYYGLQIQLITYLDAICESQEQNGDMPILPGGMLYFKIDDPILKVQERKSEEEIEIEIMKQLRMKGLLLADVKLIKEMDHEIKGSSLILPASINKDETLGKNSSVATAKQFSILRTYVRSLLKDLSTEILKGWVPIHPTKSKEGTACKYCSYFSICQFDTARKENTYRLLQDLDKGEIWKLMKKQ